MKELNAKLAFPISVTLKNKRTMYIKFILANFLVKLIYQKTFVIRVIPFGIEFRNISSPKIGGV